MQRNDVRGTGIIENPSTPPTPPLQVAPESVAPTASKLAQHNLHGSQPSSQFIARPLAPPQSNAMPPLTSNGYVTHAAIIGKVWSSLLFFILIIARLIKEFYKNRKTQTAPIQFKLNCLSG